MQTAKLGNSAHLFGQLDCRPYPNPSTIVYVYEMKEFRRRCDAGSPPSIDTGASNPAAGGVLDKDDMEADLTKPLTGSSTSAASSRHGAVSPFRALDRLSRKRRRSANGWSVAKMAAAGSAAVFLGVKLHAAMTRVPLPEPCRRAAYASLRRHSRASQTPAYYQHVPNTLELFRHNRVICPGQPLDALRNGQIASTTTKEWEDYRTAVQHANQGWKGKKGQGRGIIVFKRGGSGSTWFDTLLGNHPDVDFRHEAHHSVFAPFHGPDKATQKMRNFLTGGKKCRSESGYCGFSISPTKHAEGVDFSQLVRDTGASIVVFVRTNVIKRLLGLERKSLVHALPKRCRKGSSYKPEMKDDPECVMNSTVIMGPARIWNGTDEASFLQAWDLIETAMTIGAPVQILSYEAMQKDLVKTFDALGAYSGWPLSSFDWSSHVKTAKVTSEDLRLSIKNFDEVEQWLQGKQCFLDMLHSESQQIFPLCNAPRNFTVNSGDGDGGSNNDDEDDDDEEEEEEAEGRREKGNEEANENRIEEDINESE